MLAHFTLSLAASEVAFLKVLDVCRMNGPVVACQQDNESAVSQSPAKKKRNEKKLDNDNECDTFAVGAAASFDEAVVEGQVVADRVAPARTTGAEVRVIVEYVLVNVGKH